MQTIRLTPNDLPRMSAMLDMYAVAFDDTEHYCTNRPSDDYQRTLLARPDFIAITAFLGDAESTDNPNVIGGLCAYVLPKFEQARSEVYIYDLAVAENHRRQGVATALIAHVQTIAVDIGAWVIYVQADYGDDPAIALYTKLGVREDVMHFDIPVRVITPSRVTT